MTPSSHPLEGDLEDILEGTRALWDELRGARIFVTGGTGFVGCWLLDSFGWARQRLGLDTEMVVLTRDPGAFAQREPRLSSVPGLSFVAGDVRSFAFPPGKFSHVIHAAAAASARLNVESPLEMMETIIGGTRRTLEFAGHCGARVFLHTSSGGVYGRQPDEMTHIPEDYAGAPDPLDPWSVYGESKRAAELLCTVEAQRFGFQSKNARIFALLGPRLPLGIHYAIGNFIRDALQGGPIRIGGDGTPFRSYLYASDLMVWLWTILVRGAPGRAYNVGSGSGLSIADAAREVSEVFGGGLAIEIAGRPMPGQRGRRYVPSVERARLELGLQPRVDLATGIRRTAEWNRRPG
jgi:nucleoside-diphosphate-sugar epimerase